MQLAQYICAVEQHVWGHKAFVFVHFWSKSLDKFGLIKNINGFIVKFPSTSKENDCVMSKLKMITSNCHTSVPTNVTLTFFIKTD